jgi:hypothetical protein
MNDTPDSRKTIHDLEDALYTFNRAVKEIEKGYRFDDSLGGAKIASLRKALTVIESGVGAYLKVLKDQRTESLDN